MSNTVATAVADAGRALGADGETVGFGSSPRYELFHAANSICSQKARVVLAHHGFAYVSHPVNIFAGQSYLPAYVRLRMMGCDLFGGPLAARHDGATGAETGGCDGAVVPTLIDRTADEVIVDSKRICIRLDEAAPESDRLRPAALAAAIDAELRIVDDLPNYQMLMGRPQAVRGDNESKSDALAAFSRRKVAWCDRYLREFAGDATLTRAYAAKRAKELSAATDLFSPEAMRVAYDRAEGAVDGLETRLAAGEGPWLFGERLTLADLFWGIELMRMKEVGAAHFWEAGRRPAIASFAAATETLAALQTAIVDWPGARF